MLVPRGRRWKRPTILLSLVVALAVVLPASASAAVFMVNSTGDAPDKAPGTGGCETATASECTLRAALEESDSSTGVKDTILFDATVFQGQLADTITPATVLPTITAPVEINAGTCPTAAGVNGPCAGVSGPAAGPVLTVEADETSIYDLAVTGGQIGIDVINASAEFVLRGSWIGLKLDGSNGGNSNDGIFIDPESNAAIIGGGEAVQRNIIGFNSIGLEVVGADETAVQGNWFGLQTDGVHAAPAGENIEIADSTAGPGFKAENNQIGSSLSEGEIASPACDGTCNVISGATSTGIDLKGDGALQNEAPSSGPTRVNGNFIGLDAAGSGVVANSVFGIFIGNADDVLVGGAKSVDTNFVTGGAYGVYEENGNNDRVAANAIGTDSTGATATPPTSAGVFTFGMNSTESPTVVANDIHMASGAGIHNLFLGAEILNNTITGAFNGILSSGDTGGTGNLIEGNVVKSSAHAALAITNSANQVFGNTFEGVGFSAIFLESEADGNRIGGDTAASENVFTGSSYNPIALITPETAQNEVGRNRGSGNGGSFIGFFKPNSSEPNSTNGGVVPPVISTALQSGSTGTAEPGAKLRVFRKATEDGGELASFLGEAVADGSGSWKVTYASQIPTGTHIAATQTNTKGGTSELAFATSAADPTKEEPVACPADPCGKVVCLRSSGASDCGPDKVETPQTKITKAAKAKSTSTTAKFKFTSTIAGSTFECKLDKGKFGKCRSPKTYKKLKLGKHVFKVRAKSSAGVVDPTPATKKFKVKG